MLHAAARKKRAWTEKLPTYFLTDETSPKKQSWSALQINCDGSQIKLYKGFLLLFLESVWPATLSYMYPQSFPFKYHFQIINLSKKNLPGDRRNRSVLSIKVCLFSKRTNICGKNILNSIGCYITYLMGKVIETQFFCSRWKQPQGLACIFTT